MRPMLASDDVRNLLLRDAKHCCNLMLRQLSFETDNDSDRRFIQFRSMVVLAKISGAMKKFVSLIFQFSFPRKVIGIDATKMGIPAGVRGFMRG